MHSRVDILNCPIDSFTMSETVAIIDESIKKNLKLHHVVVNAAKLVNMQYDTKLYESVVSSDIINPDGMSVVWASRLLGAPLPERVSGIDMMERLVRLSHERGYLIYFLGARQEVVKRVVDKYIAEYSPSIIAGYRDGYFAADEEQDVAREISSSRADILFVAISSPRKEVFLNTYKDLINAPFIMGVGGSFDVVSGLVKRAPVWMQRSGLEWFYRLLQEPRRMWRRYLYTNSLFIYLLIKQKLFGKV